MYIYIWWYVFGDNTDYYIHRKFSYSEVSHIMGVSDPVQTFKIQLTNG